MFVEKRKAFSLVELLVVISVVGLLMAILMPALGAARSQARAAVCQSNLRQLVLANIGYTNENDGFYVPAASDLWETNSGNHRWHGVRDDGPFEPLKGPLAAYLANGKVKECPQRVNFVSGFEQGCGGYGYNMAYIGSRLWESGITTMAAYKAAYARTTRVTEVARPSETLMFADCAMSWLDNGRARYLEYSFAEPPFTVYNGKPMTSFYLSPSIHFHHRDWANIGWTDGHIDSRRMAEFKDSNVYGVNSADMKLGWFEPIDNTPFDLK